MNVTVIDYKAGNLTSVVKALRHLGAEVQVTENAEDLARAERIILPGVGHFAATRRLDETGMTRAISTAIAKGVPFLGICVGMQWLLQGSREAPDQPGLGHFLGRCDRFPEGAEKVPHVGWNQIFPRAQAQLFAGVEDNAFVYFTHSYLVPTTVEVRLEDGSLKNSIAAVTSYIQPFAAAVEYENVFGVQFHPEKSGETGLKVLKNFLEVEREQFSFRTEKRYVGPSAVSGKVRRREQCHSSANWQGLKPEDCSDFIGTTEVVPFHKAPSSSFSDFSPTLESCLSSASLVLPQRLWKVGKC